MKHVLVVDDQSNIRKLIRMTLEGHFALGEAENGMAAMREIQKQKPDTVLLDLMMPGSYDGFHVLEWIKLWPERRDIEVIAISALSDPKNIQMARRLGVSAYLTKPFRPYELLALLGVSA